MAKDRFPITDQTVLMLADEASRCGQGVRARVFPGGVADREVWLQVNDQQITYRGSRAYRAACSLLLGVMQASQGPLISQEATQVWLHLGAVQYILDAEQRGWGWAEQYPLYLHRQHTQALVEHMSRFPMGSRELLAHAEAVEQVSALEWEQGQRLSRQEFLDLVADRIQRALPEYA